MDHALGAPGPLGASSPPSAPSPSNVPGVPSPGCASPRVHVKGDALPSMTQFLRGDGNRRRSGVEVGEGAIKEGEKKKINYRLTSYWAGS